MGVSARESSIGLAILHLDSIPFPYSTLYTLRIEREDGNGVVIERELLFNASRSRGFALTVSSAGSYRISFNSSSPESRGRLGHDGVFSFSSLGPFDNFYANVSALLDASPTPSPASTDLATQSSGRTSLVTQSRSETDMPTQSPSRTSVPTPPDSQGDGVPVAAIVVPIVGVVLIVGIVVGVWWYRRRAKGAPTTFESVVASGDERLDSLTAVSRYV
jgi:cobalamin biosynthesis Mg chelatase CobN